MTVEELFSGFRWTEGLAPRNYTVAETAALIESTKWAHSLTGKEVLTLARYVGVCEAEKGAMIVREGGREAHVCLVIKGRVSIVKEGSGNKPKQIGFGRAGSTFGEMSLVDGEPRSASVVADESTMLVVLTDEGLECLFADVPRLGNKILLKIARVLSQRLRQTNGALWCRSRIKAVRLEYPSSPNSQ
jgi:CRP-like cAMP-binding protein